MGLKELEGFFGLFGEEGGEGGCVGRCGLAERELPGAFLQDSGDFPEGVLVRKRKYECIAPFDDVPEEPELVAENVCQLVEHQAASPRVSRQRSLHASAETRGASKEIPAFAGMT